MQVGAAPPSAAEGAAVPPKEAVQGEAGGAPAVKAAAAAVGPSAAAKEAAEPITQAAGPPAPKVG